MQPRRRRGTPGAWILAITLVPLVAACGSTVAGTNQVAAGQAGSEPFIASAEGDGLSGPAPAAGGLATPGALRPSAGTSAAPAAGSSPGAPAAPAGATGTAPGTAPAPAQGGGVAPAPAPPPPAAAPGDPAPAAGGTEPVQVGYFVTKNAEELFGAVGYEDLSPGDTENQVMAMVEYANAHGGLNGHPIEPVIGVWDATAGNTTSQRQAACSTWFEDNHAIATIAESFDTFQGCANQANVPLLVQNVLHQTQARFDIAPTMVTMSVAADDRMVPAWLQGLETQGYFAPEGINTEPVIGVMFEDTPDLHHSYNDIFVPALAQLGYEVKASATVTVSNFAAEIQNAILRFRSEGVTHVTLYDGGGLALLFMAQAESQGYRPRYGLMSYSNTAVLQDQAPPAQLSRTVGIGWLPATDVSEAQRPPDNATTQLCVEIMTAAGEDMVAPTSRRTALTYCDLTLLLQAMARAGGAVTTEGMMSGLHALGGSYESALTFASNYTAPRRDGAAAYRSFAYDDACPCFTYTSDPMGF